MAVEIVMIDDEDFVFLSAVGTRQCVLVMMMLSQERIKGEQGVVTIWIDMVTEGNRAERK